ncbi:Multimeric flavodoxin WrbA [Caloramator quimbayensis]|uniref:Multimeric flavodoxin WrbA n=1 Tax=Caloramator quimbayensis TaxID=1147123 RepID=A0A1T4X2F2_9CLOT|nr:NAD(P)H-dependent oxidoreductase [Caloramator quimbayensis]SKA83617.1 Multimeric flavodoxin WrbA [Caloramator quimbayensis]
MNDICVISPKEISSELSIMINSALGDNKAIFIKDCSDLIDLKSKKIIVALELNSAGYCFPVSEILSRLYQTDTHALKGSIAALLIHSSSELYTKSAAQNIIFLMNQLGCRFIGHPAVEATVSLSNFLTWQKSLKMNLMDICIMMCRQLGKRIADDDMKHKETPKILALHSSSHKTSNTLTLWNMVKSNLKNSNINIKELHVENGTILDCKGCSFKTCLHYSKQSSCFYGGFMVEEVYPAIENSDAVVWICPNYNDSISANLMAIINRITALYRKRNFYDKSIFSVIVSGNSGSDSVAKQLIGALNINKGFRLPPNFCLMETANDPGAIKNVQNIEKKAEEFAKNIKNNL